MNAQLATEIISNISILSNASKESENYLMILGALLMENIKKHHNEMISNPPEYRKHTYVTLIETLQAELNQEKKMYSEEESVSVDINNDLYDDRDKSRSDNITQDGLFNNNSNRSSSNAPICSNFSKRSGFRKKITDAFIAFVREAKQEEVSWYHDNKYVLKSVVFDAYRAFSAEKFPDAPPAKNAGNFWKSMNTRINVEKNSQMGSHYVYLRSRKNIK